MRMEKAKSRGWSIPIYQAVMLAGGPTTVAGAMGLSRFTPMNWYKTRNIPAKYLPGLCALGGNRITPQEILDDLAQRVAA